MHFGAINPTDDNSLRITDSLVRGKERCQKWKKLNEDMESTTDSIGWHWCFLINFFHLPVNPSTFLSHF